MTPLEMIHVVRACVDYGGSEPVRAFADRSDANAFVAECEAYDRAMPTKASFQEDDAAWVAAVDVWRKAHPAGAENWDADFYAVSEIPLIVGATMRPCANP